MQQILRKARLRQIKGAIRAVPPQTQKNSAQGVNPAR
jgi:hypothetical protein